MSDTSEVFVHAIPETGRLLPSASRWNSIELNFGGIFPASAVHEYSLSKYSKSYSFHLAITDKSHFRRFLYISTALFLILIAAVLLGVFLSRKDGDQGPSSDLPPALSHALSFFDAQKSGVLPKNNPVKFRGDSGLRDVDPNQKNNASLVGGFYDSGNNIKFSFPTAYTITVLSWSVIEYHQKYSAMGGLILSTLFNNTAPLQFPATAAFLSKLYSDYLSILQVPGGSCGSDTFSPQMLENFANSQANYILGDNPMKMSYLVGFGDLYPHQVHHRAASIPWDGKHYSCSEGEKWRVSKDPNPNVLLGAMVAGPSYDDKFIDRRDQPMHTEPTIAGNAGLVAALAALVDPSSLGMSKFDRGIDEEGIFAKIS